MNAYKEIEAEDLNKILSSQKIILVDVRNDEEVARGIIANSIHMPLSMLPVQHETLQCKMPVIFYCHSGIRSAQAAAFLASKGHNDVYSLRGGVMAWGRSGYTFEVK